MEPNQEAQLEELQQLIADFCTVDVSEVFPDAELADDLEIKEEIDFAKLIALVNAHFSTTLSLSALKIEYGDEIEALTVSQLAARIVEEQELS